MLFRSKVHELLAQVYDGVDWVLVEGFKFSDLPKVEVWRQVAGQPMLYPEDPYIKAIATDVPEQLRPTTLRPVLDLNLPDQVLQWMLDNGDELVYQTPLV